MYESSLNKECLRVILDYLEDALEPFLQDELPASTPSMKLPLRNEILVRVFRSEVEKIEDSAGEVIREVRDWASSYRRHVVSTLLGVFREAQRTIRRTTPPSPQAREEGPRDESAVQPYLRTLKAMTKMYVEMAEVLSSRSFAAAFLVASVLDKKLLQDTGRLTTRVEVAQDEADIIHSTWSELAERGVCLAHKLELATLGVERICEALETAGKSLSEEVKLVKIHDNMLTYLRSGKSSELSELVYNALSPVVDGRVKGVLCEYVTEHLCALGNQFVRHSKRGDAGIKNEDIKNYIEKVLGERGFLEYEVYSALLKQGVAAIPRLRFSMHGEEYYDKEGKESEGFEGYEDAKLVEVDAVAKAVSYTHLTLPTILRV